MILKILAISIIFYLTGYVLTTRLLSRKSTEKLAITIPEMILLQVITSILLAGWIALFLAEVGLFSILMLISILVILMAPFLIFSKKKWSFRNLSRLEDRLIIWIVYLAIIVLGIWFYYPPFESFLGGDDPGVYTCTGIHIARTGSIYVHDPSMRELSQSSSGLFYSLTSSDSDAPFEGSPFPGFYVRSFSQGILVPQFLHLFPAWIAISYSIFGLENALIIVNILSIIFLFLVFELTRRLFSTWTGILAIFLLVFNVAQLWYSRYPVSEVMSRILLFAGCLTMTLFLDSEAKLFGFLAGMAFGQVFLTRYDAPLLFLPFAILFLYFLSKRLKWNYLWFWGTLIVLFFHSFVHAVTISWPYVFSVSQISWANSFFSRHFQFLTSNLHRLSGAYRLFLLMFLLLVTSVFVYWLIRRTSQLLELIGRYQSKILVIFAFLILVLAFYGYYIRPLGISDNPSYREIGKLKSFYRLGWYLHPFGLLLGVLGLAVILTDRCNIKTIFFLAIFGAVSLVYFSNPRIYSFHFWAVRRFIPITIPGFAIGISYFLIRMSRIGTTRVLKRSNKIIVFIIFVFISILYIRNAIPIIQFQDMAGTIAFLKELDQDFATGDVIIMDASSELRKRLATPLILIFGKQVYTLVSNSPNPFYWESFIISNLGQGKRVYFLTDAAKNYASKEFPKVASERFGFSFVKDYVKDIPYYERSYTRLPQLARRINLRIESYQVLERSKLPSNYIVTDFIMAQEEIEGEISELRDFYSADFYRVAYVRSDFPEKVQVSKPFKGEVTIKNDSPYVWPSLGKYAVRVGYRWYDRDGQKQVRATSLRTNLPRSLSPGEEITFPVKVYAPNQLGKYALEIDLVLEHIAWFYWNKKAERLRISIEVIGDDSLDITT